MKEFIKIGDHRIRFSSIKEYGISSIIVNKKYEHVNDEYFSNRKSKAPVWTHRDKSKDIEIPCLYIKTFQDDYHQWLEDVIDIQHFINELDECLL